MNELLWHAYNSISERQTLRLINMKNTLAWFRFCLFNYRSPRELRCCGLLPEANSPMERYEKHTLSVRSQFRSCGVAISGIGPTREPAADNHHSAS